MNIVLTSQWYPPEFLGGVSIYIKAMAHALRALGHGVSVVTSTLEPAKYPARQDEMGVQVYRIKRFQLPWGAVRVPVVGKHIPAVRLFTYNYPLSRVIRQLAVQGQADIVEYMDANAESFLHPRLLPRVPHVVKMQGPMFVLHKYYTDNERYGSLDLIERAEKHSLRQADGLVSPSHFMARVAADEFHIPLACIPVIRNPLDAELLSPPPLAEMLPPKTVLFVGRIESLKGAFVMGDAIPRVLQAVPDAFFVMAGPDRYSPEGGSSTEKIKAQLARANALDRAQFLGMVPRAKVRALYGGAAVSVIPSLFEDYPYTLVEALAHGVAVVATNQFGMAEIIRHGETGLNFEVGSGAALAEQIILLLQNDSLRARLAQNGQEFIRRECDPQRVAELTAQNYAAVIAARAR